MKPDDLVTLRLAGSPTLAPDGRIAAGVQTIDPDTLRYRNQVWTFESAEPLAEGTLPVYSPSGEHLAYLSKQDGVQHVHVAGRGSLGDPGGGSISAMAWLDDQRLAALVEHKPDVQPDAPIVVEWLRYRRDGGPSYVEPTHELWLLNINAKPQRLCEIAGRVGYLITSHGSIVYTLEERHSDLPAPMTQIRKLDLDGTDTVLWSCPAPVAALTATALSGTVVAVSSAVPGHSTVGPRIWLLRGDNTAELAFPDFDTACERAVLSDSRPLGRFAIVRSVAGTDDIVFLSTVGEDVALFTGDPADRSPRRLTPEGCSVSDFSGAVDGQLVACVESATRPVELHLVTLKTGATQQVSDLNQVSTVAPEPVRIRSHDGVELHGLLYRAGSAAGPLVTRIHGGPHLAWGTTFDVETQALVTAGYHVLMPNLRGSAGRGDEFRALTIGDWGGGDYLDLMAFVDWTIDQGIADRDRLFLAGGSYGGFLTNWAVTRTRRFRAAVSERCISNFTSKVGTADNGYTVNRFELGGADVFDASASTLLDRSPLRHAAAITTPMLLIHGADDYRCPIEQSEQLFVALRRLGVPSQFVRFPGENHSLTTGGRPDHRLARMAMIQSWLAQHDEPGTD